MNKRIAFVVMIIIEVLSLLCLIWSVYACSVYWKHIIDMVSSADGILGDIRQTSYFKICLIYLFATINNFLIIIGNGYLFFYLYKNDFSISTKEHEMMVKEKKELRKQKKLDKLQAQIDKLEKQ